MYNFYAVDNYEFDNYIEVILTDIIASKLPNEIFKNIIKQMNLNYQWVEMRKFFHLDNSPLNLEFNLENYKDNCEKYIPELTITFVYQDYQQGWFFGNPTLYYITGPKKIESVDVIYHLDNKSINNYFYVNNNNICIENFDLNMIKEAIITTKEELTYSIQKKYYENFFKGVYMNKVWRCSIDIREAWNVKMDVVKKYQNYHNPIKDQIHMNKLSNEPGYIASIHACVCFSYNWNQNHNCNEDENYFLYFLNKYNKKQIKFKDFIKELTAYLWDWEGYIGIIIDDKFSVFSTYPSNAFTVIDINHLNGTIKISELTDFTSFNFTTPIIKLVNIYGNTILY